MPRSRAVRSRSCGEPSSAPCAVAPLILAGLSTKLASVLLAVNPRHLKFASLIYKIIDNTFDTYWAAYPGGIGCAVCSVEVILLREVQCPAQKQSGRLPHTRSRTCPR